MLIFAKTDIGKVRNMNQDYYYVSDKEAKAKLCILADGMGGYTGGEIASSLATNSAKEYIEKNFDKEKISDKVMLKLIKEAMQEANKAVHQKAMSNEELEQMGTTLEICIPLDNKLYIGHIGDSRIYRIRENIVQKLTTDHSYVEKLIKDGTITRQEALYHPKKNMLVKVLGCTDKIEPDFIVEEFKDDDIILICSDGLTNMISEEQIYEIVKKDINTATDTLISTANEFGGLDNISVIIIKK